ncbi:extracellular solute-binding protein [Candidatus Bipolaricaulota bacterium]|nr:extracellular solute-binding protein [Candidatus Bipolaricaulota bacterium]
MRRNLDKKIAVPLYRQLKQILEEEIERGAYRPGERIPTEEALCRQFGVSRVTVRQALGALANEGLVLRHQGSGTFVNHRLPAKTVPLRAVLPEEHWVPSLRKAFQVHRRQGLGGALQPQIKVLGRPELHAKIVSAVGRGVAPDLALIDWVWLTEFADLDYLAPLDEIDKEWAAAFKADLFPLFVENNCYRGHLYGMQPEANVSLVWYRRDWFEVEGLPPPQTWDELVTVAQHFGSAPVRQRYGLGPFPLAFPGGPNAGETTTYILSSLIWSAGDGICTEGRIVLGEGARQALRFLYDLVHTYRLASPAASRYEFNEVPLLFARGALALAFGGSYEKALIQQVAGWDDKAFRERVGFVPIPAGPGGRPAATVGGMVYVVFRQSRHPEAALEVLKILASPSLMMEMCRLIGRKPTRVSVVRSLDQERDWFIYETSRLLEIAHVRPIVPRYAQVSAQLQDMLAQTLEKRKSPAEAIAQAQAIIDYLA